MTEIKNKYCVTHLALAIICVVTLLSTFNLPLSAAQEQDLLSSHNRVVVCYVSSWAAYRPGRGAFSIDDLDPKLCTHLVYAFAGLNATTGALRSLDPYRDLEEEYGLGWYSKLTGLKRRYPHLKVTLAVGGWNEGSKNYSTMAASPALRKNFVDSAVKILQKHGFDGLDMDWEFPGSRGGNPEDKANFVTLIKELRTALAPRGLIVTAALGAGKSTIDAAYDIAALGSLLDLMHVMCYDYHGAWDAKTGANAPLRTRDSYDPLSIASTIDYLKSLGAPAHKIVLGVPIYGRTFLLSGPELSQSTSHRDTVAPLGSQALTKGFQGSFTREDGFMGFNEICLEVHSSNSSWKRAWDDVSATPYAENKEKWLSYDDERSVAEKARFAVIEGLAGVMVWSIDTDDFHGDCESINGPVKQRYPLVYALNVAMVKAKDDHVEHKDGGHSHGDHDYKLNQAFKMSIGFISIITAIVVSNLF